MTICQDVEPQLSQLVDGHLPDAAAQATVRAHLEQCASCRGVLQDLEKLRRTSRALGPVTPPDHLWLEVAGQLRLGDELKPAEPPHRAMPVPRGPLVQWIGLAAALLVATIGAYYFYRPPAAPATVQSNAAAPGTVEAVAEELNLATSHYEKAIAQLEALTKSDGGTLDPALAKTLQQNIHTIDQAITESRTALTQDPGSEPARESLFEALRRKMVVLQATVNLMNEMRKGNQAGAAEAIAAFGKKS
jgi:anti-sigma factor RsiW